jgi:hypothetical protein
MARVWLLKRVRLIINAPFGATFKLWTDMPGNTMTLRHTASITAGLYQPELKLPGTIRAHLLQVEVSSWSEVRLYGGSVLARALDGGDWAWLPLPGLPPQLVEWAAIALPIPTPPKSWAETALPIPTPAKTWAETALPLPPRDKGWQDKPIPMQPTPDLPAWIEVPPDA